jgi:hypothetical protein
MAMPPSVLTAHFSKFKKLTPRIVEHELDKSHDLRMEVAKRISRYVTVLGSDQCWEWPLGGYGKINIAGVTVRAHRLSYMLNVSRIPNGMVVCHSCDNPRCVNPDHLFIGTQKENHADMVRKGRGSAPPKFDRTNHPHSKLTAAEIAAIKNMPGTAASVAAKYGICAKTVYRARHGEIR